MADSACLSQLIPLSSVVELWPDAVLLVDEAGIVQGANARALSLFVANSLVGRSVESLMPERYRAGHVGRRRGFCGDSGAHRMDTGERPFLIVADDGRETPVEISLGSMLKGADGHPLQLVTLVDCSQWVTVQNELRERESVYRKLFDDAPQPYQSLDVEGNFLDVNNAWLKLFGARSKALVIGRFFGDFMAESSRTLMGSTFERFMADGHVSSPVFEARRLDDGSKFLIQVHGHVDRDAEGRFIRTQCLLTDVSERERAEKAILKLNAELEERVRLRTSELLIARSEAEAANAVKTRFLMNASHEMRTPLSGILGSAQVGLMRAKRTDAGDSAELFENILGSGKRLQSLIESLLRLTEDAWREHSEVPEGELHCVPLAGIIEDAFAIAAPSCSAKQQSLVIEMQHANGTARCSPALILQVLAYLIDNAMRYSPEGKRIVVRVSDDSARSGTAEGRLIEVIDEGCGIPEGEMEAIFEPFYQSSRTWTGAGGTGLGLPLCRSIVAKHRGTLKARNRESGGAVFELRLPN